METAGVYLSSVAITTSTGLGEPLFPPTFAAVSNALYKATGKRYYNQPYAKDIELSQSQM